MTRFSFKPTEGGNIAIMDDGMVADFAISREEALIKLRDLALEANRTAQRLIGEAAEAQDEAEELNAEYERLKNVPF